jgi:hypothetical protein
MFKRVNGMVTDSIVDREAWDKIMKKAIDQLPVRINEQADANKNLMPNRKDKEKLTHDARVLITLHAFNIEFELH